MKNDNNQLIIEITNLENIKRTEPLDPWSHRLEQCQTAGEGGGVGVPYYNASFFSNTIDVVPLENLKSIKTARQRKITKGPHP
jgi:hypothetical protein